MQIILVRHGRPDHGAARWSTPVGMKTWVERYNAAEVVAAERPDSLVALAGSVGIVVCSSLQRCIESRSHLECDCCELPDPLFAEPHLPYPEWGLPLLPSLLLMRLLPLHVLPIASTGVARFFPSPLLVPLLGFF